MKNSVLIILLSGVVATAIGLASGRVIFASKFGDAGPGKKSGTTLRSAIPQGKAELSAVPPLGPSMTGEVIALMAAFDQGNVESFLDNLLGIKDKASRLQALLEVADKLSAAQFEQLFALIASEDERMEELFYDEEVMILLIEPWVNKDPDGAINFGIEQEGERIMFAILGLAFLAAKDYDMALAKLEEVKQVVNERFDEEFGLGEEDFAGQVMMFGVSLNSPAEALRRIREGDVEMDDPEMVFEMGQKMGEETLEEILKFEDPEVRDELASAMFDTWSRLDPLAALKGIERYFETVNLEGEGLADEIGAAQNDIFSQWAKMDPQEALRHVDKITDRASKDASIFDIAEEIAKSSPDDGLALVRERLGDQYLSRILNWNVDLAFKRGLLDEIVTREGGISTSMVGDGSNDGPLMKMMYADPAGTMDWMISNLDQLPGNDDTERKSRSVSGRITGRSMAGVELESAIVMLDQIPPGAFRDGFINGLVSHGARTDPLRTAEFALSIGGTNSENINKALVHSWIKQQPEAAAQYAANLGEKQLDHAIDSWASTDVEGAFQWLTETGSPAVAKFVMNDQINYRWIEQDAWRGADVTTSLPVEQATEATALYVKRWADTAPAEASAYINDSMQPGPVRDAAIVSLAAAIAPDDPAGARQWVSTLSDPVMREEALRALP